MLDRETRFLGCDRNMGPNEKLVIIRYNLILSYIIKWVFIVFKNWSCEGPLGIVSRDRRCTWRSDLWSGSSPFNFCLQHLRILNHWAIWCCFAKLFGDAPTTPFIANFKSQVQHFKKDVSNSATQDSIMNADKKSQLTCTRINFALKDSICDSPLPKNLKLTILASNASSSSTKVLKCPHIKNVSIFTHIESIGIKINTHTYKDKHNA
ncbi:hypothetical protein H5410_021043 [Solanum commersonii]|uniref:Uncharacterized protein n=1 Tax=Solanum commersonii TaxID=4109 RepID=A0A9J5ZAV1_SOLCO|nr:hypothetical protein H5410_021043 [Solanum commersonii]